MGLRPAASVNDSDAQNTMAPALTEPLVVNNKNLTTSPTTLSTSTNNSSELSTSFKLLNNTKGSFQLAFEKHISYESFSGQPAEYHMDQEINHNEKSGDEASVIDDKEHQSNNSQTQLLQQTNSSNISDSSVSVTVNNNNNNTIQTMGLQKEPDKENAEMEQMIGELASSSDIDLLQVFKSLEAAPAGDGLCELTGGLSLFNDVDVMNMCSVVEDVQTPNKDMFVGEIRSEIEKLQLQMERKTEFLLRRLRKMQSRQMGQHISEEVGNLCEDAYRLFKRKEREHQKLSGIDDTTLPAMLFDSKQTTKPVSSNAMKTFLKKINHVSATQSASLTKINQMLKTNYGSNSSTTTTSNKLVSLVPRLEENAARKIEDVAGALQTELRMIETAIDSDATASSSGGESADEAVSYNNATQEPLSIGKRAAWRWARDRAAVASRWSWLLAQISDLEYRIRQHNELYNQIRRSKGLVTFEDSVNPTQTSTKQSVNGFRGILPGNTKPLDVDIPPNGAIDPGTLNGSSRTRPFQRNGFRKRKLLQTVNLHTISKKAARPSTIKCGCQWPVHPCALCTGRQDPTAPRDLPDTMPAAERVALLDPCFHPVLSFPEDVSHSIHIEAIARLPEWQNKALRTSPKSLKGVLAAQKAAEKEDRNSKKYLDGRKKYSKKFGLITNKLKKTKSRRALQGVKFSHILKKNRKISGGSQAPSSGSDNVAIQHTTEHHPNEHGNGSGSNSLPRSKNTSPIPMCSSGINGSNSKSDREVRKSRNSYDIDNIIIPYSVAASTRVELLPYKEIPTPKWRIIEDEGLEEEIKREEEERSTAENTSQNLDIEEDISDEIILQKHERALQEERKKFQTFMKFPWSTRSRANRRTDSRAESSGANTPDPTSPAPNTPNVPNDQESIPSPANPPTPQTPQENVEILEKTDSSVAIPSTSISSISGNNGKRTFERRRTVSIKLNRERDIIRDDRSNTPDVKETVPPYEPLEFPLGDVLYDDMIQQMPIGHKNLVENYQNTLNTEQSLCTDNPLDNVIHDVKISTTTIRGQHEDVGGESDDDSESLDSVVPEDPNDPEWQSSVPGSRS